MGEFFSFKNEIFAKAIERPSFTQKIQSFDVIGRMQFQFIQTSRRNINDNDLNWKKNVPLIGVVFFAALTTRCLP